MMPYNINDYKPFREGNHSVFPSSENKCRHVGNNTKRQYVRHFKVDGEVFRGSGEERCDYLLLNDEVKTSYYIELKGSDLSKAIRQIENTIKLLSPSLPGYAVLRRIVYHTGSHNVHASEVLRWKNESIQKTFKGYPINGIRSYSKNLWSLFSAESWAVRKFLTAQFFVAFMRIAAV